MECYVIGSMQLLVGIFLIKVDLGSFLLKTIFITLSIILGFLIIILTYTGHIF